MVEAPSLPPLASYESMLRRYLYVLGARADRLDDILQDVFTLALDKQLEERDAFQTGTWLRRAGKNLLLRQRHGESARREIEIADEIWTEEHEGLDEDARVGALRSCVDELPERSRSMLHRTYRDRMGREALSAEFGMKPNGVKTTLRRIREGLRACIQRRLRREQ